MCQHATASEHVPVVLADGGVENVNAQIDALLATGVLQRVLAMTELKVSNSMIEAWWRCLKHHWLLLHSLDSVTTVRRLVAFYVAEHNRVLPHFGVSRPDAGRDVLRDGERDPGGTHVARRGRASSTPGGQPISVVRDESVAQRGCVTTHDTVAFRPPM